MVETEHIKYSPQAEWKVKQMEPEIVFIEFVVRHLVDHPGDVKLEKILDERGVLLKLTVNDDDIGRVIGKRGATAQSLRTLLRALGTRNNERYNLRIMDSKEEFFDDREEIRG